MAFFYTSPGIRGIGDALFVSAIAHVWRHRHPYQLIAVRNKNYELFFNNPDVDLLICGFEAEPRGPLFLSRGYRLPQVAGTRWLLSRLAQCRLLFGQALNAHHGWPPQKRLLTEVAECCELSLSSADANELRPWYWPYPSELKNAAGYRGVICVHSNAATYWTPNKQWPVSYIQQVVDHLRQENRIVQLGSGEDVLLVGVEDLRGKTSLRETAAILAQSKLFIGMEGGLMHLARAVDTRSVIVFTGFITPEYSGYNVNVNLFGPLERTDLPCWNREKCNCDCAERVSVEAVLLGVEQALSMPEISKHYIQ